MTDLIADRCASSAEAATLDAIPARTAQLGELEIRRLLPRSGRRMVGPWCFLDRYGPLTFSDGAPMDLAPHPHIGLQTVSWLLEGEILHRDSLGNENVLRPGGVNLMTAGAGIAHSEVTPATNSGHLSGAQLWIALPEHARHGAPSFEHRTQVTRDDLKGGRASLLLGEGFDTAVQATTYSPLIAADVEVWRGETLLLPLRAGFEHALLVVSGSADLDGTHLTHDVLFYLGTGREELCVRSSAGARMLLVGGAPFGETVLMWWNFVARTAEEISAAAEDWNARRRFGPVHGYAGPHVPTPPLRGRVRPPAAS